MSDEAQAVRQAAEAQWGLVTTAQAARHGVGRVALSRLAARGVLERLAHGLYRVRGGSAVPFLDLRGAWLLLDPSLLAEERWADPNAVVSHRSAARLLDLGDLPEEPFEFTVPARRQSRDRRIRFHRARLARDDWAVVDGLPVTVARRVVADLLADRADGGHVAAVVADALRRRLVDADRLAAEMAPYAAAYGLRAGDGAGLLGYLLDLAGESPAQLAEHVEQALASPASMARRLDAAATLAAAVRALPPVAPELPGLVRGLQELAAAIDALRSSIDQPDLQTVVLRLGTAMQQALDDPAVRALRRDAALRDRLAEQAAYARKVARQAGYGS